MSPSTCTSQTLISPQQGWDWLSPSHNYAGMLTSLNLCRSGAGDHSCCVCGSHVSSRGQDFTAPFLIPLLLYSFHSIFQNVLWTLVQGRVIQMSHTELSPQQSFISQCRLDFFFYYNKSMAYLQKFGLLCNVLKKVWTTALLECM